MEGIQDAGCGDGFRCRPMSSPRPGIRAMQVQSSVLPRGSRRRGRLSVKGAVRGKGCPEIEGHLSWLWKGELAMISCIQQGRLYQVSR